MYSGVVKEEITTFSVNLKAGHHSIAQRILSGVSSRCVGGKLRAGSYFCCQNKLTFPLVWGSFSSGVSGCSLKVSSSF
jgi:hypothetical protein